MRSNTTMAWTLVLFLGGWLLFGALRDATDGYGTAVSLLIQLGVLAVVIGVIVLVVRRQR